MTAYYGLAVGHDQTPTALHLLSAPLFWRYEIVGMVNDEWFQAQEIDGNKHRRLIGRPRARWTLPGCTLGEIAYLQTNIWTAPTVALTMRMPNYNLSGAPFRSFNCIGHWLNYSDGARQVFQYGVVQDAQFEFERLVMLEESD